MSDHRFAPAPEPDGPPVHYTDEQIDFSAHGAAQTGYSSAGTTVSRVNLALRPNVTQEPTVKPVRNRTTGRIDINAVLFRVVVVAMTAYATQAVAGALAGWLAGSVA